MNGIRIGVIPAAGQGKRMGYLSHILPKCLFPVYDKPIIHHVIENMKGVGIEQVHIIVNYQKDKVTDYFKYVEGEIGIDINFIEQPKLSGIADAIMLVHNLVNEPFMVILGDDCTITESLDSLVRSLFEHDAIVVEGTVTEDDKAMLSSTCCLKLDHDNRIIEIEEKPKQPSSNVRGCGIYAFQPDIFKYIEKTPVSPIRNEVEITQTIALVSKDGRAYGEFINGTNININSYKDLLRASILLQRFKASSETPSYPKIDTDLAIAGRPSLHKRG